VAVEASALNLPVLYPTDGFVGRIVLPGAAVGAPARPAQIVANQPTDTSSATAFVPLTPSNVDTSRTEAKGGCMQDRGRVSLRSTGTVGLTHRVQAVGLTHLIP